MKKYIFILASFFIIYACGVKQTQTLLASGNYDEAINNAVSSLQTNKDKKGKQDYVYILEDAFAKAKERDLDHIAFLKKEGNPAQLEKIYTTYMQLYKRQEKIKPLLPLRFLNSGKEARFDFSDYSNDIITTKNALSAYLYTNAKSLLIGTNKLNFRKAFDDLSYINQINPNYKDVLKLMEQARFKGTDFVLVYTKNETNIAIPSRLQEDLLDFNTYGLNENSWAIYHNKEQKGVKYDYGMMLNFRAINISLEQAKEKEFVKEKQIKDGQKALLNNEGKPVVDSNGKAVMIDNMRPTTVSIYEFKQLKICQITAKIDYINLNTNQLIQSFPVASQFIFENIYATYRGDRRAADDAYHLFFDKKALPFPSNEQMIYDTGEDLKQKLKSILTTNNIVN
jgi:hypothetical protein